WAACHAVAARAAAPAAQPPYQLSVFAQSANGYSQPDSMVQWGDSIVVGFQNHVAKDGSDGKSSTIVQYALNGRVQRTFSVPGHNDGLRLIGLNELWCMQNEDANPNLVIIDLETGRQTFYSFPPSTTPHGGGFDDIVELNGQVYFTASNPNTNSAGVTVFPALVRATVHGRHGNTIDVEPVLFGNANAIDIPTGATVQLNLSDPDSMTVDPRGTIVFTSQADGELIFVKNPLTPDQIVGRLPITAGGSMTTLDDTQFAPASAAFMLFSDVAGDTIYRLDGGPFGFAPGTAYCGSDSTGVLGVLNLDTGVVTPIGTGFKSIRGIQFVTPR
ncbi:MAG: hypothetical protein JOZ15_02580, partial [Acidobacteria bacterium]|nr:hypothetical protein [Acidobacteriota bacterium]